MSSDPHITQLNIYGHFWDVDGSSSTINYSDNGYGSYYSWAGAASGGHFSDRQGSISNCVFHYGCFGTSYPEIQVWINGNGAWTSRGGGYRVRRPFGGTGRTASGSGCAPERVV